MTLRLALALMDLTRLIFGFGSRQYLWSVELAANAAWSEP